jgi:hypothetical protein
MKYGKGKWIDSWGREILRASVTPEAQRPPNNRAMNARPRGHCFLCDSYVRQDAGLTSLRAKSHFLPSLKTQRPLIERLLIEWRRATAVCGHSNKFKKM